MIASLGRFVKARIDRVRRSASEARAATRTKTRRAVVLGEGLESRYLLARISGLWSGVFTSAVGLAAPISGFGTNSVQFGTPSAAGGLQNSLTFLGARIPTTIRIQHHSSHGLIAGTLTFQNTLLANPPLTGLNLRLGAQANIGNTAVNVPLGLNETPDVGGGTGDVITLIGKPRIRLPHGRSIQIVGFGVPSVRANRFVLTDHFTVPEGQTMTVPIIVKVI